MNALFQLRLLFLNFTPHTPSKFSFFQLYLSLCWFLQIIQFLDSNGFLDYAERGLGSGENNHNLLDKLQDAIGRGQNPISILPSSLEEPEIITISDPDVGISSTSCHFWDCLLYASSFLWRGRYFKLEIVMPFSNFFLVLQDQVPNILMTGFLQTLEHQSKKKREGWFLQQQVELLKTLESIFLGIYLY